MTGISNPFKIEHDMPHPPVGKCAVYPFKQMAVGDSFVVAGEKAATAQRSAYSYGHRHGQKFMSRAIEGGTRIWRIE